MAAAFLSLLVFGIAGAQGGETDHPLMNGKLRVTTLSPEEIRYTGKPYSKALGGYVFNARAYDAATSRWTTPDPSGFPDGANNRRYVTDPTRQADPTGLYTIVASDDTPDPATADYNSNEHTVTANDITPINAVGWRLFGWTITPDAGSGSGAQITLNVTSYTALNGVTSGSPTLGAQLSISNCSNLPALSNGQEFGWMQVVTTNDKDGGGTLPATISYLDNAQSGSALYGGTQSVTGANPSFYDRSSRGVSDASQNNVTWKGSLYLVETDGFTEATVLGGISWGYTIE